MTGSSRIASISSGIGDEVGADVAAIELHSFDDVEGSIDTFGFFDSDDAVFTDLVHRIGNQIADFVVVVGGNGADLGDFLLAANRLRHALQFRNDFLNGFIDTALEVNGIHTGGHCLEAFGIDLLGQYGCRGRTVAGDIAGLGSDFANHLGAMFSIGSSTSTSFATVTPSLVTVGAPYFLSITTLRPRGPRVVLTAFANASTPRLRAERASNSYAIIFAAIAVLSP